MHVNPTTPLGRLVALLERYIAPLTVASVLKQSLERLRLHPDQVSAAQMERLVEEAMVGLRLFCEASRLSELMVELAELCGRETER
ncbi:MAG TPA: hypothetical protein VHS09_00230 [Polyangiaceae bacterium]|jgi:hypothetical protein|nr:hypothetical protein [Polyangiaceae bacterium]